jgi:hypothetical protein
MRLNLGVNREMKRHKCTYYHSLDNNWVADELDKQKNDFFLPAPPKFLDFKILFTN